MQVNIKKNQNLFWPNYVPVLNVLASQNHIMKVYILSRYLNLCFKAN